MKSIRSKNFEENERISLAESLRGVYVVKSKKQCK